MRRRVSSTASVPAPVGGWNVRDSIANMDEKDAVTLDNWFPTPADVLLRKGYSQHVTGIGSQVESLMPYNTPSGTQKLFCAAGTDFYDVSSSGSVGAAVQSGLSNARWQHANFTNSAGVSYLLNVNGEDNARYYNGTSWATITNSGSPSITGVDTDDLIDITVHKNRVWFVEIDSLSAWFLPVNSVGGSASEFDLSGICKRGGYLMAIETWTLDAGEGVDDHWVAITSEGECIVYKGTDPSAASTWALVGVWEIGRPIGRRCMIKMAGDILLILEDGVLPLSKALISSRVNPKVAITDKIQGAMGTAVQNYKSNYGWELLFFPGADMLILNVPVSEGSDQEQYSMNTITGSWGRFTGIEANCWALLNGEPYFGSNGFVGQFWDTFADNTANIEADAQTAFNYFKSRGRLKRWTMARPIFSTSGEPSLSLGLNVDYSTDDPSAALTFTPTDYAVWDTDLWDDGIWGGGLNVLKNWQSVSGIGFCAATRLRTASKGVEVRWQATDFVMEPGEVL